MKKILLILLLLLYVPVQAQAEEPTPAWPAGAQKAADWISYGTVIAQLTGDTVHAWQQPDRKHAFLMEGARIGATIAVSELVKHFVHRTRPDGSDQKSFFSEHTALAAASSGWSLQISIPLTFGTGYGRMAANKHHPTDVAVGAAVGGVIAGLLR